MSTWGARGRRVAAVDRLDDAPAALGGIERFVGLRPGRLRRELLVLDHAPEPPGIVARAPMVLPGCVVHALRNLREKHEVLRTQVEAVAGTPKVEAEILGQLPFRVLAHVAVARLLRSLRLHWNRNAGTAALPEEDFVLAVGVRLRRGRLA